MPNENDTPQLDRYGHPIDPHPGFDPSRDFHRPGSFNQPTEPQQRRAEETATHEAAERELDARANGLGIRLRSIDARLKQAAGDTVGTGEHFEALTKSLPKVLEGMSIEQRAYTYDLIAEKIAAAEQQVDDWCADISKRRIAAIAETARRNRLAEETAIQQEARNLNAPQALTVLEHEIGIALRWNERTQSIECAPRGRAAEPRIVGLVRHHYAEIAEMLRARQEYGSITPAPEMDIPDADNAA